jgi:acetate kinase
MTSAHGPILTLNGGSSSIRFAIYQPGKPLNRVLVGNVSRIGSAGSQLSAFDAQGTPLEPVTIAATDHPSAAGILMRWLETQPLFASVDAVGHRVVHGMHHIDPEIVTQQLLNSLRQISPYDPEHLPGEIAMIEAVRKSHPQLIQVACFDTAFHRTMPRVATLLPIPRRFHAKGVQRYGFHGLSYAYLMEELAQLGDPTASRGRVILAHLGNGASLAAVRDGRSMDTSMGFTPTAGLVMGSRSGDLDPGIAPYLAQTEHLSSSQFYRLVNHESGLLGISETTSDMRDLLALEATDPRAADAVELFCYQTKKWLGSFAAALGGLDTLIFSGGIGENCPSIRSRVCEGLSFLGIDLNAADNARNAPLISSKEAGVTVRVIHTDEEQMIARLVLQTLS